jgi:hypothetical protein
LEQAFHVRLQQVPQGLKPGFFYSVIAALKRCATQKPSCLQAKARNLSQFFTARLKKLRKNRFSPRSA